MIAYCLPPLPKGPPALRRGRRKGHSLAETECSLRETRHILQGRYTAAPGWCWAALCGVDSLSVRAAKAVPVCLTRTYARDSQKPRTRRKAPRQSSPTENVMNVPVPHTPRETRTLCFVRYVRLPCTPVPRLFLCFVFYPALAPFLSPCRDCVVIDSFDAPLHSSFVVACGDSSFMVKVRHVRVLYREDILFAR